MIRTKTEWTEIVRGKQQVTARMYLNSEGGQQVTFHSALRMQINMDLKESTDPASLVCLGRLFHEHETPNVLELIRIQICIHRR